MEKSRATPLFVDFSKALDSIQREVRANTTSIWFPSTKLLIMLYKSTKAIICSPDGDNLLRHCHWSFGRRYISTIFVYNLPRLRTSIDLMKENGHTRAHPHTHTKQQQTMSYRNCNRHRLLRFLQLHLPKPNPYCIAKSK